MIKKVPIISNADLQGLGFKRVVCKLELQMHYTVYAFLAIIIIIIVVVVVVVVHISHH